MISYLQIENLTKSYGDRMLFSDVTFGVNEGDKIGVIAKNGTGKSTMLRIIAGRESQDSGTVTFRNGIHVAMLDQEPQFATACTAATAAPELEGHADRQTLYSRLLTQMGLLSEIDKPIEKLSGGQRKRVALARAIASEPDMIILDEPTNHLDIKTIEWLEGYLRRSRVTLLMVTHDRYFLDRVCNKIIEIDRQSIFTYEGNYDYYLRRRAERIEAMSAELAKVRNTLRKEQDWMSRQPQARAGKAKFRIDQFYDLKERSHINLTEKSVQLHGNSTYIGNKIFEAEHISKRFGDKVILNDFNYIFARYEKVGIVGENGVGKSTFIKMLQGLVAPDSGHFDVGETVKFGYYSQDGISFNRNQKVIDAVTAIAEDIELTDGVRVTPMQFLQHFLFSVADQQKYIHTLSGGELCRLHLATVLMRRPNFLILDEPTNDLDIVTLGILEEYLCSFKGCVIIISHDRFFLDSIVDHLFVMEGDGVVKDFPGNYTEYRDYCASLKAAEAPKQPTQSAPEKTKQTLERKAKLTFKERKEFDALTEEIDALTAEKQALEAVFNSGETVADIAEKSQRYNEINSLLDEKEMRWLELSEKA
jgi:ATP-binding cassette subfamily F protein uup